MKPTNVSPCIVTEKIDECRKFYTKHFNAIVTFDCGWFINISLNTSDRDVTSIQFMSPRTPDQPTYPGQGITFNIDVPSADEFHKKLVTNNGLPAQLPLDDHPWGDRGFAVIDPAGVTLYIYHLIEPADDFKQFFNEPEITSNP
ncbi:glyoxalase [Planctomycetota bacterium]|nr:glyoxalase [Planctomycetota bacterium]